MNSAGTGRDSVTGELEAIRAGLADLAERLATIGIDTLREAVASGETRRPDLERRVTRARHSVERAVAILVGVEEDGAEDG